jgi:hypothetical protein
MFECLSRPLDSPRFHALALCVTPAQLAKVYVPQRWRILLNCLQSIPKGAIAFNSQSQRLDLLQARELGSTWSFQP